MQIGDFEVEISSGRISGGWQSIGILPDGKKITSAPKSSREEAESDVKQQAEARLYPQRRYDVNRPFESLLEDEEEDEGLWKDVTPPAPTITFIRDVEALVQGGQFSFGAAENEFFEKGQTLAARSVERMPAPDTDMAKIILQDGRTLIISIEDFELTESMKDAKESAIVRHMADKLLEDVPSTFGSYEIGPEGEEIHRPECPNCGGVGEAIGQGAFQCINCNSKFMADINRYDTNLLSRVPAKASFYPSDGGGVTSA